MFYFHNDCNIQIVGMIFPKNSSSTSLLPNQQTFTLGTESLYNFTDTKHQHFEKYCTLNYL
jgi:hypothetical protein